MSFKIYQIHRYGGEWEDAYDYIVASYLSKEKAIMRKTVLELEEEQDRKQSEKCHECYASRCRNEDVPYCHFYEPFDENVHSLDEYYGDEYCVNEMEYWNYEYNYFKIEEVEVIE